MFSVWDPVNQQNVDSETCVSEYAENDSYYTGNNKTVSLGVSTANIETFFNVFGNKTILNCYGSSWDDFDLADYVEALNFVLGKKTLPTYNADPVKQAEKFAAMILADLSDEKDNGNR